MLPLPGPPQSTYEQALAWADHILALDGRARTPMFDAAGALDAYVQIERKYGIKPEVEIRRGRCLITLSRYSEAAKAFGGAAPKERDLAIQAEEARRKLQSRLTHGLTVMSVVKLRGVGWVGLCTAHKPAPRHESEDDRRWRLKDWVRAEIRSVNRSDRFLIRLDARDFGWAVLAAMPLARGQDGLVFECLPRGADAPEGQADIFRITPQGLKHEHRFLSVGMPLAFNDAAGRLCFETFMTWKVWWRDTYEWRGGKFVFASPRHPEHRTREIEDCRARLKYEPLDLASWCELASAYGNAGRWTEARVAWERAAICCRRAMAEKAKARDVNDPRWSAPDWGLLGRAAGVLKEVEQRLRWIKRGDYNHPLLYRPQDCDFQVAPYRLRA